MSDTRERIREHVRADPGVHFSGLVRALDLATGQVQYHVRELRDSGDVVAEECHGRTHYFPEGYDAAERRTLALLRRETSADVVAVVLAEGACAPAEAARALDVADSTVRWHADRLVEQGVLERERDGGGVSLSVARPAETARLLAAADQPLPARLVARFERLVDRLLEP